MGPLVPGTKTKMVEHRMQKTPRIGSRVSQRRRGTGVVKAGPLLLTTCDEGPPNRITKQIAAHHPLREKTWAPPSSLRLLPCSPPPTMA